MTDNRTTYYCDTRDVTRYYKPGHTQTAYSVSADCGSGVTSKDEVYILNASGTNIVPGDWLRVYDTANPMGETKQVYNVTADATTTTVTLDSTMSGSYETTAGGAAQLMSAFVRYGNASGGSGLVSSLEVGEMINDAEAEIERITGHAWTSRTISNEVHYYPYYIRDWHDWKDGIPLKLNHRKVKTFNSTSGDYIYVNEGTGYTNKLGTWTESLNGQFWVDYDQGVFYVKKFWQWHERGAMKFTYRYGESSVPDDVRMACAFIVTINLLEMEHSMSMHPGGGELNYDPIQNKIDKMQAKVDRILKDRTEIRFINR